MSVDTSGMGLLVIISLMAVVTLATRWGGVFVMSFVPLGPRVRNFINAMSGSVLVAVLAPLALTGDSGARLALGTTAVLMLLSKKPLLAIAGGVVVAAVVRQF
ncbi:AzlD domain-containing protein [Pseudomonas sp. RP23018S]|uniref:AzlD family protein n=1 Tax=Pseudomonas sp. RP23018S TaxID=3096037 RepID=UPI002ACA4CAF|nr:AzlD domain-containing protein [Pseudomonas sp. RP23018S]MDZ5602028.1 AzlD domain-containing protein [Pseudomonas sp. RP23018S]